MLTVLFTIYTVVCVSVYFDFRQLLKKTKKTHKKLRSYGSAASYKPNIAMNL